MEVSAPRLCCLSSMIASALTILTLGRSAERSLLAAGFESVTLAATFRSPTNVTLSSSTLRFSGYEVQTSSNLVDWLPTGVFFGPAKMKQEIPVIGTSSIYFRLQSDISLDLSCAAADATTLQLNWPPNPFAAEYKIYRDGNYAGSTVGRCGYFLDTRLNPATTYRYFLAAYDSNDRLLGFSPTNQFSTSAYSRVRTHYSLLALAFYPGGPDGDFSHVRTFFRHKLDFLRLASVNSANLVPYNGDILPIRAKPPVFPNTTSVDYARFVETPYPELDGYSVVDLVEKGDVDVVWVLASPDNANFGENVLVGNKDINPNPTGEKWHPAPARCSRSFFVNANTPDARAYDAYSHFVEGVMSCVCDAYPDNWPRNMPYRVYSKDITDFSSLLTTNLHLFERFRLADQWNGLGAYASPNNANCGSSHFPPSARRDTDSHYDGNYAYYDRQSWQRYINCAADDWLHFPDLTGLIRKLNGYDYGAFNNYTENDPSYAAEFGASPQQHSSFRFGTDGYHQWWFFHLPHNPGVSDGKLNNWWSYLYDFNHFDGRTIHHTVLDSYPVPTSVAPIAGEYGTEVSTTEAWGYFHSCCDFGPYGQIAVVDAATQPGLIVNGQRSLQVVIDQESFQYEGRSDLFYPISRNARWNLSNLRESSFCLKPGLNPGYIAGANPVIRLCSNGGNRIEFAPLRDGRYANLFQEPTYQIGDGWFRFTAPINGDSHWEVNVVGYIDPNLDPDQIVVARERLKARILSEVNYVEISLRTDGSRGAQVSFYLDDLEFRSAP